MSASLRMISSQCMCMCSRQATRILLKPRVVKAAHSFSPVNRDQKDRLTMVIRVQMILAHTVTGCESQYQYFRPDSSQRQQEQT